MNDLVGAFARFIALLVVAAFLLLTILVFIGNCVVTTLKLTYAVLMTVLFGQHDCLIRRR